MSAPGGASLRQPTLKDVAERARVSYATADRVLNGRAPVREDTAERVHRAVAELGYVRNVAAANLSRQRIYRFVVVLPSGPNAFFQRMRRLLAEDAARAALMSTRIEVREVAAFDAAGLAAELDRLAREEIDGVAAVGLDGPELRDAAARLRAAGIALVSLVSPLPGVGGRDYVGIDNGAAGRTAGRLTGLSRGGRGGLVQPVVGALNAQDHRQRLAGFHEVLAADFPALEALPPVEGRDDARIVEREVGRILDSRDIVAIYNVGAGNSGLARALAQRGTRPFCIVHELVAHSRRALEDGIFDVVLDQRPEVEIRTALDRLRSLSDGVDGPGADPLFPTILVRDNLPQADET